jgi:hypothetical protein
MITYTVNESGIFCVKFSGPVSFAEIKNYLEKFKSIKTLPSEIRLLYDFLEGEIDLVEEDLGNIARLADESTVGYTSVRTAFLVNKPDATAFTYIFSQFAKNQHSIRRIFSTYDAALNWLNAKS